jgi:flagellar motor switch protein FliM
MPANNPDAENHEALSQSEVEQLLVRVSQEQSAGAAAPSASAEGAAASAAPTDNLRRHDFRGVSLLTAAELRRARLKLDDFARALATRLSIYLRMEFGTQVAALQTLPHPKFIDGLPKTTHLTLCRVGPLPGTGVLAIPMNLSLALLDRLLGGPGVSMSTEAPLTEIDLTLLDYIVQLFLNEWGQTVASLADAQAEILGHETNPRFLPALPGDTQMLLLSLEARLGECAEQVQFAIPFHSVESIFRQPEPSARVRVPATGLDEGPTVRWQPTLDEVPISLSAGWEGLQITAQQLAHLKVGDVLPLEPDRFSRVQVRLARITRFVGRLGSTHDIRAVELTGTLADKRIPSA